MEFVTLWNILWIGALSYILIKRCAKYCKYYRKFDWPFAFPVIGNIPIMIQSLHEIVPLTLRMQKRFEGVFIGWMGHIPIFFVQKGPQIEKVLSSRIHVNKPEEYDMAFGKWFGGSLLVLNGPLWKSKRKLFTPAFHFGILETFLDVFDQQANVLVKVLQEKINHGEFDFFPYITRCTLDIIGETAMGTQINSQTSTNLEYFNAINSLEDLVLKRLLLPWLRLDFLWNLLGYRKQEDININILHGFAYNVIAHRKLQRSSSTKTELLEDQSESETEILNKRPTAFLDLALDAADKDPEYSDEKIRADVDNIIFTGHEEVAANLAWTIIMLSMYKNEQIKVQQELDDIFGDDINRKITSTDISKMKYLECCIKETSRLYPSVPFFGRKLSEDCDFGNGQVAPKGSLIVISALSAHRDKEYFPDPDNFDPTRFFPENGIGRHPYTYIPFSAGQRNCIGQKFAVLEAKVLLAKLLLTYNFETIFKTPEEATPVPALVLRPFAVPVIITSRKKNA